jgi:hypothetical protein
MEYLLEIAGKLLWLHIERTKALNTRRNDQPALIQPYHLTESGGMLTRVMGIADFGCTLTGTRH